MNPKLLVVLALLPLALAWPMEKKDDKEEKMEEFMKWKKMMEKKKEEFMNWKEKMAEAKKDKFMEWKEKHEDMVEKFKDYKEEKMDKVKEEFMDYKEKQEKMHEKFMEYKKKQMDKQKEEFMNWKEKAEMKKKMEDEGMKDLAEDKMKLIKKWKMWDEKMQHLEHFDKMMDMFKEKKHAFVGKVIHQTLDFCNCQTTKDAMKGMGMDMGDGMGANMPEDMQMPELKTEEDHKAWAEKVKQMSEEKQKKIFLGGMVKTLCGAAKAYAIQVFEWKQKYLD